MKKIIKGCKEMNRKAQREMVDHLSPYLYVICRRYTEQHEDAQDLLQESLIAIFNNIKKCKADEIAGFKAWCRRIAINKALEKKRKRGLTLTTLPDIPLSMLPAIQSQLNVDDILKLLQRLPENQRIVFNLAVLDGFTHREIAEMINIQESSSRTFLTRARQKLQALMTANVKEKSIKN